MFNTYCISRLFTLRHAENLSNAATYNIVKFPYQIVTASENYLTAHSCDNLFFFSYFQKVQFIKKRTKNTVSYKIYIFTRVIFTRTVDLQGRND